MKTTKFLPLLAFGLSLAIALTGTSAVRAECTDQTNFSVKGFCRSEANDGYYIKAGIGIPIARAGFQCKFLQISNDDMNKVIFIPMASGTTGDNEFSSLLNAVSNNSSITAFVSLSDCSATCDTNNNLIVTVGSNVFTYPCGDYAQCINDINGNGECTPVGCADISLASGSFYQQGSDPTPIMWCPHYPLSREDKANGLDVVTVSNAECPLAPTAGTPCYFSTCGNNQMDGSEDCDTAIDTSGRCDGCDCGNFVSGGNGTCLTSCIITPTCTTDAPYLVNCGCSMCPSDEQLVWPEKLSCKLSLAKTFRYDRSATSSTTYYDLPRTCKSCGTAQSDGTYTPTVKVRTHAYYKYTSSGGVFDRDFSNICTNFSSATPQNVTCNKTVASGSTMNLLNGDGVACPSGTYNDTTLNELKRGILSCNLCSGMINGSYSGTPTAYPNGTPFYYDGACHVCQKGTAVAIYGNSTWRYCPQYGIADLNNDGDVTDPGEDLVKYLANSDADAPYYYRNSSCDSNKDGLLDTNKAFHRWYSSNTCVPYTFCTDTAITDSSIYLNCPQITDAATLATLLTQKPACPAEKDTLVATASEYTNTVCTPCPTGYNHINAYIRILRADGTSYNLDYRSRVTLANNTPLNQRINAGKFTCHSTCTSDAPYYYDDGSGSGAACHSCPAGYSQILNNWTTDYTARYIECSEVSCPLLALIYDDTNDGVANPTCHACPQGTYTLSQTTNWPLSGSKCWPQPSYCNTTTYPGNTSKYNTGVFYRIVTDSTVYYSSTTGALNKRDDTTNISPRFTDSTDCACPAGTRYQDNTNNGSSVPDYSYYYLAQSNLYRPTAYCVTCPAGYNYFYQGTGDTTAVCHTCDKTYYYQASSETSPSCHACTSTYYYQLASETSPSCHVCPATEPICAAAFNCSLPQYSCNIYSDPDFDPDAWDHMPNCDCRCKLTESSCSGTTPYLNPLLCKCQATSLSAYCGNGALDPGEECDTIEDGDSYLDGDGNAHMNRCIGCKIHRVSACDSRAYTTWINGAYTERPIVGQCAAQLTPSTNNSGGLTAYTCSFWEPKRIDTAIDSTPVHESEATATSGCIFTCQSGYTYNPVTKTCGM